MYACKGLNGAGVGITGVYGVCEWVSTLLCVCISPDLWSSLRQLGAWWSRSHSMVMHGRPQKMHLTVYLPMQAWIFFLDFFGLTMTKAWHTDGWWISGPNYNYIFFICKQSIKTEKPHSEAPFSWHWAFQLSYVPKNRLGEAWGQRYNYSDNGHIIHMFLSMFIIPLGMYSVVCYFLSGLAGVYITSIKLSMSTIQGKREIC